MSFVSNGVASDKMLSSAKLNNPDIGFNDSSFDASFDPIFDFNFENKAVNDFIKKSVNKTTNPFDTSFWNEDNLKKITPKAKNTVSLFGTDEIAEVKQSTSSPNQNETAFSELESIFKGIQINKGTGMAKGGRSTHKLDFQY